MTTRSQILDRICLVERRLKELKSTLKLFDNTLGKIENVYFHYINHEKEYKFTSLGMLTAGTRENATYAVSEYEYEECKYINVGVRKCDIFNDSHLAGLRKANKETEKFHDNIDAIKKGEY